MPKVNKEWTVLSHGPIEKVTENLWRVEGGVPRLPLKRVMTIARLSDGRLVVHNGIALGAAAMAEIDAWGKVAFLLVPNRYHRLDAPAFGARYPDALVLCPRGARKKVEDVVTVSADYSQFPVDPTVRLEHLEGVGDAEGAMIVASVDGVTIVLNDIVFNMPHGPGFGGAILRVLGSSGGPRVSTVDRALLVKDKPALRACLERLAQTPRLVRVVVSHHETIADQPGEVLARVAATL